MRDHSVLHERIGFEKADTEACLYLGTASLGTDDSATKKADDRRITGNEQTTEQTYTPLLIDILFLKALFS